MIWKPSLLALLTILAAATVSESSSANLRGHINVGGSKRSYHLHVPRSYTNDRSVPLVIVLHGAFGNASTVRWDSKMSVQSDHDGFIVAYPNGVATTWNAGGCCGVARSSHVDDVAYLRALINRIESEYDIDHDRIYIAGVSNGGMLAYRAGCELSDLVAAIAPVAGCMYPDKTSATEPVGVIAFNGTGDKVIPFDGGGKWLNYKVHATPVADAINFWVRRDHCDATPIRDVSGDITKELYGGGEHGTEVCLYTVKGGGHLWPGGRSCIPVIGGKPSKEISATELMCQFFWAHPKQHREGSL